jgi:uncharacterized protein (DUF2141 family)
MTQVVITFVMAMTIAWTLPPQKCSLTITAQKFHGSRGNAVIAIYSSADGFPDAPEKAVRKVLAPIVDDSATAVIDDLEPGTYAAVVLHDENGNGKMDKTMMGRPKEGYGVSNNAKPRVFGPPSFRDAAFVLDSSGRKLVIDIHY